EVVVRVQGILCCKELPPVENISRTKYSRCRYLRQSIGITGLGREYFDNAIYGIMQMHGIFNCQFKENDLEPWQPSMHDQMPTIDANNRYFTPRRESPSTLPVPFQPMVDLKGTLTRLASNLNNFIYTQDNQVHYFEYRADNTGIKGYEEVDPNKFCIGDIVEVQLSFVVIPIKDGKNKLISVMRALTLLN
ncbi:hypothetical protein PILCRDRAFT_29654, partial [Piloderma croceum F 1598]